MKINWRKWFAVFVLLLILGTILAVVFVGVEKIGIWNKVPELVRVFLN